MSREITREFLLKLKALNLVMISGSWARGEEREDSDIDFLVKEDRRDRVGNFPKVKNIRKIIALLNEHGYEWSSHFVDTIYTTNTNIQLEFADIFPRYNLGKREIMGVEFNS